MADNFLTGRKPPGVLQRVRSSNGDIIRFDPATGAYGTVSRDGTIRTFFKPGPKSPTNPRGWYPPDKFSSPLDYFVNGDERQ